ncbi:MULTISPECIES: conjugative transposon protein TraN [Hymenobacter]|uniref:Bacteroides conjugative transposon TraN protein n=1 Tax=Hymenobacter mucosus TaxID=1411120 RepID=A0A239AY45_9BACT|nr:MULTISPECIES: conjugative transposon protein TraN [Hymenobacter]MDF7815524.1 conjugative transposon protein TraN [Hymenobacter sp. YC55]SNS00242.1 Bacteroides conjugative transposon TraN protein [Hymenobacter mucosus]
MNKPLLSLGAALALALLNASPILAQANTPQGRSYRANSMRQAKSQYVDVPDNNAQRAPKMLDYSDDNEMASYPLYVSDQKTTHLVFPFPVTYVDLGSAGLIAAKATGAENIVRVKAAAKGFAETNMTVLTSDGKLYSFLVNYNSNPKILSLNLGAGTAAVRSNSLSSSPAIASTSRSTTEAILSNSPIPQGNLDAFSVEALAGKGTADSKTANQLSLRAGSVGYQNETLFFPLHIANKSNVTYDIDFVKFYIQDKKVAKRTAEQAIEISPIYVYNGPQQKIEAQGKLEKVFIFKKFTIPDKKQLVIELYEKGGGRNIKLTLANSDLLKARTYKGTAVATGVAAGAIGAR